IGAGFPELLDIYNGVNDFSQIFESPKGRFRLYYKNGLLEFQKSEKNRYHHCECLITQETLPPYVNETIREEYRGVNVLVLLRKFFENFGSPPFSKKCQK